MCEVTRKTVRNRPNRPEVAPRPRARFQLLNPETGEVWTEVMEYAGPTVPPQMLMRLAVKVLGRRCKLMARKSIQPAPPAHQDART